MERQEIPKQLAIIEIKPEDKYQEENKDPMKITPDESDLIEETHDHDEDEMSIKPDFQVHVAVNENDNIIEIKPDINNHEQGPVEIQECMETNHRQVEVKTEYDCITVNVEEAIKKDQVNNGNIMEHNNEVSYQVGNKVCNI